MAEKQETSGKILKETHESEKVKLGDIKKGTEEKRSEYAQKLEQINKEAHLYIQVNDTLKGDLEEASYWLS